VRKGRERAKGMRGEKKGGQCSKGKQEGEVSRGNGSSCEAKTPKT